MTASGSRPLSIATTDEAMMYVRQNVRLAKMASRFRVHMYCSIGMQISKGDTYLRVL